MKRSVTVRWVLLGVGAALCCAARQAGAQSTDTTVQSAPVESSAAAPLVGAPEANLFVGGATTSIPIAVPPGRKNLTPKLALTYASGAGPGPYGYGWDLPLGKIQRSTKHGVPSCTDPTYGNDFVLVLPGANIECTLDLSTNMCMPAVQGAFLRIEYFPADNHWEVWDKNGPHYILLILA